MSEHTSFYQQSYSSENRQGRRRWVPKGVMLLAILFVVGLLGACHSPSQPVAAIAVPIDMESLTNTVDHAADDVDVSRFSHRAIVSGPGWVLAQRETVALNTF